MPTSIDANEAKSRFAALFERIERGEQFVITRHGRKIARLVPAHAHPDRRAEAVRRLKEFRKGHTLDLPVRQLIEEGRR